MDFVVALVLIVLVLVLLARDGGPVINLDDNEVGLVIVIGFLVLCALFFRRRR